jgi:conjugal transfer pilus assembly protein TraA
MDSTRGYSRLFLVVGLALLPSISWALISGSTDGGVEFKALYDFIYAAGTGYLGRSICIIAGLVGLGVAAISGKAIPAIIGVMLAVFGALGPQIVNTVFTGAII